MVNDNLQHILSLSNDVGSDPLFKQFYDQAERVLPEDDEIVGMFLARDERALSCAETKYGQYCTAVAMNILKNRWDAEECVNDALMKAWVSIPPARPSNLGGFLAKITKNVSINRYKKNHTEKRGRGELPMILDELSECVPDKSNVEHSFEQKELMDAVNGFIGTLADEKRMVFVLRYWYCMSEADIAVRRGVSAKNISVTLFRLRKKLMNYLKERGF